ncbi:MAG: lysylphosphatidylglycerol synthase transmembrane domain-containing protein [Promethearchaeota archaeon]
MRARTYYVIGIVSLFLIIIWLHVALLPIGGIFEIVRILTDPGNVMVWIIPAFGLFGLAYILRAIRWWVLLRPFKTKGNPANQFPMLVGGIFLTYVAPLRAGDIATPYWLREKQGTRFTAGLASIVWARVLDFAALILIIIVSGFLIFGALTGQLINYLISGALVAIAFVAFFILIRNDRFVGLMSRIAGRLFKPSERLKDEVPSFVENFAIDLRTDISSWNSGWAFLISVPIWMLETAKLVFIALIFGQIISISQSMFILGISYMTGHILAILLPAGISIFITQTAAITLALEGWGIAAAASIALLDALVYIIGLTILGAPSIATMGRGYRTLQDTEHTETIEDQEDG